MPESVVLPTSLWHALARIAGVPFAALDTVDAAQAFADAASRHRLVPLALQATSLPQPVHACLRAADAAVAGTEAQRRGAQDATLARLRASLDAGDWIGIKGIDYRTRLYRDARLRAMDDIDLLVRPGRFPAVVEALRSSGYVEIPDAGKLERSFRDPHTGTVIDAYACVTQRTRATVDYQRMFADARVGDDGVPRASAAEALALHALVLANLQFVTHLRKYVDLWLMAAQPGCALAAVDVARRWNIRRAFQATFELLAQVIPEAARQPWHAAAVTLLTPTERALLRRLVLPRSPLPAMPPRWPHGRRARC